MVPGKLPGSSLIYQVMTVRENVPLAPGEISDTARVDLPLSIMHTFQQEMASGSLFFFKERVVASEPRSSCLRAGGRMLGVF